MSTFKTPGVYIKEQDAFSSSVVAVPTAVPAYIGYVQRAEELMRPTRIGSMPEFLEQFGVGNKTTFSLKQDGQDFSVEIDHDSHYRLFDAMRIFYANGGGPCYIVPVGTYGEAVESDKLMAGLETLVREQEPTMVLCPDALNLEQNDCYSIYQAMLTHCGARMRSRICIVDVYNGAVEKIGSESVINTFREQIGANHLAFGCVYYPWVNTTIVTASELNYTNINAASRKILIKMLTGEASARFASDDEGDNENLKKANDIIAGISEETLDKAVEDLNKLAAGFSKGSSKSLAKIKEGLAGQAKALLSGGAAGAAANPKLQALLDEINKLESDDSWKATHNTISAVSGTYKDIIKAMRTKANVMPPSAAMAGVMSLVDSQEGVHKAPANISLNSVVSPTVLITAEDQENLNAPLNGKAVNAIRSFVGKGTLVWGARTLDANSLDWRYINVRRTMIMIEQSVKNSIEAYVFEVNTSRTWIKVKTSIDNFLTSVWKQGALAGASPSAAFDVAVGLGQTMTPEDILEGVMRVSVKVAITRPAEFIEISFEQKMQES
jgi:hypothetical protein